ncbi:fatty acyl-CoA synthetase [Alicyclobacillus shizuokensis]|uniref:fatty acyl-CoA synthetase n=1 Tax=Alicyclobacillus shizuokensis TaxID=392014 RepID=UPI0009F97B96|nr:fatty acyl-CoA synthetase [Alicyclobacillus shizuokensis]MCL6627325.1 long-chain-fatty-acid--CoA ligase [Alicyclobacillus shizuokensis]
MTQASAPWRRQTLGDTLRRSRMRHPHKRALMWRNECISYGELDERANQLAHALLTHGVRKGDRVAILATNCLDFVIVHFAVARTGAILVPINFMFEQSDILYILNHCRPKALFVTPNRLRVAEDVLAAWPPASTADGVRHASAGKAAQASFLRIVIDSDETVPGWTTLAQLSVGQPREELDVELADTDVAHILYTSGTESRPKGVMLTHQNLIWEYVSCIVDFEFQPDDVLVHAMPFFHSAQLHAFLGPSIYIGSTGVILDSPEPGRLLRTLQEARVTQFFCPPTVWIAMTNHPDYSHTDLTALRKCYFGAAATPMEVMESAARELPQVRIWNTYGQTEVAPFATVLRPEEQRIKPGSVGRPCLNMETAIMDEEGHLLSPGELGEIVHRSPHVMLGYYADEPRTEAAFAYGWFHTGDLGFFDADGFLTVVDRKKDMVKTGGENVSSLEVEEVLYQHSDVQEAAVIGVPHPYWGEAVTAVLVPRSGAAADADEVLSFCRRRLAPFKVPKYVVFTDTLPKNPSGKILKRELRVRYRDLALQAGVDTAASAASEPGTAAPPADTV